MMNNPHYLYRMTVLVAVAALAPVVSHDVLCNSMLPVVVAAAKDKVTFPFAASGEPHCHASFLADARDHIYTAAAKTAAPLAYQNDDSCCKVHTCHECF